MTLFMDNPFGCNSQFRDLEIQKIHLLPNEIHIEGFFVGKVIEPGKKFNTWRFDQNVSSGLRTLGVNFTKQFTEGLSR